MGQNHTPVIITIARSADAFTRLFDVPLLEKSTLQMIQHVWAGSCPSPEVSDGGNTPRLGVRYAAGTSTLGDLTKALDRLATSVTPDRPAGMSMPSRRPSRSDVVDLFGGHHTARGWG